MGEGSRGGALSQPAAAPTPGPLSGVRVIELDAIGPVPLAAMVLADMGAQVVRIARPVGSGQAWDDTGGQVLNRNRPRLELNLKDPAQRDQALALIDRAEVLIEGFRPGVTERLGLGPGRHPFHLTCTVHVVQVPAEPFAPAARAR